MAEAEIRDPRLKVALKNYCTAVLEMWRQTYPSDATIPREIFQRPRFDGNTLRHTGEIRLDLMRLLTDRRIDNPAEMPAYSPVEHAMRSNAKIARHLDTLVGTAGSALRVDVPHVLRSILGQLLEGKHNLDFDEDRFATLYAAVEDFFYAETIALRFLAPLPTFEMSVDRIDLGGGLALLALDVAEREEMVAEAERFPSPGLGWHGMPIGWERYGLVWTVDASKVFGEPTSPDGPPSPGQQASQLFQEVTSALRLFKGGAVGYTTIRHKAMNWQPMAGTHYQWGPQREVLQGPHYSLSVDEATQFRAFWDFYRQARARNRPRIDLALRRMNFGYERIRAEDRLIDYMIALEALLTKRGELGDLKYRLALRGSRLLGTDPSDRRTINEELNKAYKIRSDVVHGSDVGNTISVAGMTIPFQEFVDKIAAHLRNAIRQFMTRTETAGESQVIADLDESLIAGN